MSQIFILTYHLKYSSVTVLPLMSAAILQQYYWKKKRKPNSILQTNYRICM